MRREAIRVGRSEGRSKPRFRIAVGSLFALVTIQSIAQDRSAAEVIAHCRMENPVAASALRARGTHAVVRIAASCRVEGGPLHGTTLTTVTVYLMNEGRGQLISGYANIRDGDSAAAVEVLQGSIAAGEGGAWTAEGRDLFKVAKGRAATLEGTVVNWTAGSTGPDEFVIQPQVR